MKPVTLEPVPDMAALREAILEHVTYSLGATPEELSPHEMFQAVALGVRDLLVDRLLDTQRRYRGASAKRLYYLSVEFLIGRSLTNNLLNLGMLETCRELLREMN